MEFEAVYKICVIISCLFEIYMVMDFYGAFHEYRFWFLSPVRKLLAFFFCVGLNILTNFQNNSFLNLAVVPALYLGIIIFMFQGSLGSYFLHWIAAAFVIFSSEFIFLMLQGIPMNIPTDQLFQEPFVMLSSIFAVKLVSFILFLILKQISKYSAKRFDVKIFGCYIIVPVATLGSLWAIPYVRQINKTITAADIILVSFYILMLIGNIVLFYMFVQYNYIKEQEVEKEVALAKYREQEKIEKQQRVLVHNIKHYLKQIAAYAAKGADEEIVKIVGELQVEFLQNESKAICANGLLNSILLEWRNRAEEQGVSVDIFVEAGFNIDFMRGIDIMAVFGNLLDNAGEAASQCGGGKVGVQLFMQNDGAFSVIRIKNDYTGKIKQKNGVLISTKKEGGYHGIGIKNAKEIIQRNGGYMQNEYSDHTYETTIMIPISRKK